VGLLGAGFPMQMRPRATPPAKVDIFQQFSTELTGLSEVKNVAGDWQWL